MGRKRKNRIYFGHDVQEAIIEYNNEPDPAKRSMIYRDKIHYAFDKLAENTLNTYKMIYFDEPFDYVKNDIVSFLLMKIDKFDPNANSKAFSYFSVVARNYAISVNNPNYDRFKREVGLDDAEPLKLSKFDKTSEYSEFIDAMIDYFDENIPHLFKKRRDIEIAYSIVELLRSRDSIENFNKKNLYIMIREMTNVETSKITVVMNVFRKHYKTLLNEFKSLGRITGDDIKINRDFF